MSSFSIQLALLKSFDLLQKLSKMNRAKHMRSVNEFASFQTLIKIEKEINLFIYM